MIVAFSKVDVGLAVGDIAGVNVTRWRSTTEIARSATGVRLRIATMVPRLATAYCYSVNA
jgi:hypothetical protein